MIAGKKKSNGSSSHGFTLVELLIVCVIVAVLASLGIPAYTQVRERTISREGEILMKLVQTAQKTYQSGLNHYYPTSGSVTSLATINSNLGLALATKNFAVIISAAGAGYTVRATRPSQTWTASHATSPACAGSGCY